MDCHREVEGGATDLNGDGKIDLATANGTDGTVSVLFNQGGGMFAPALEIPAGPGAHGITAVDLTGDGQLDLAVTNLSAQTVTVLQQNNGTFTKAFTRPTGRSPLAMTTATTIVIGGGEIRGDNNGPSRPRLWAHVGARSLIHVPKLCRSSRKTKPMEGEGTS